VRKTEETMKLIQDIRVYKSDVENTDGKAHPHEFAPKALNTVIHRIVMKLREANVTLGDFDHLYLNFTTCLPDGVIKPAGRSVDRYHNWYRYYDIGVERDVFETLDAHDEVVLHGVRETLIGYFGEYNDVQVIDRCVESAVEEGEAMTALHKEKKSAKAVARIYLRYLDSGMYWPLLRVCDLSGAEVFRADLPQMGDLLALGDIQLSSKKVTIKPRKSSFAADLKPLTYEF